MKILFIGDVYGRSGREALEQYLPELKQKHAPDIVIVNGENAASGRGINPDMCKKFYEWGTDVITSGNHIWDQRQIIPHIEKDKNLLRPCNYPQGSPGKGHVVFQTAAGKRVLVINAMGRVFMPVVVYTFKITKDIIDQHQADYVFVDFHAETTSEKMAFGHYFDGKVTAVVGTHTHIPTADEHILPQGTAYMTDVGMTGDYDSIIGAVKDTPIQKFVTGMPGEKMKPANGEATLCGVLIEANAKGLADSIVPIRLGGRLKPTSV